MTTGEKIKSARTEAGLSQEQLAEKLNVSRSAVAKWESEGGTPDIGNLKNIADLLGVSIDYLLKESEEYEQCIPVSTEGLKLLDKLEYKNKLVREKFPAATIYVLQAEEKVTKPEKVIDNLLGFFTDASFGTPELIKSFKNVDKSFYLVEKESKSLLVMVTDEYIKIHEISVDNKAKKFEYGGWKFIKTKVEL